MSYEVKQGDFFGRLGQVTGQGLAESIPKEVDRYRLSQGLKQFEQDSPNLSPTQQLTRLASIPGLLNHPQLIQTYGELAKQQNLRNAYARKASNPEMQVAQPQQGQSLQDVQFGNVNPNKQPNAQQVQPGETVRPEEFGQPQIVNTNPLRPEAIPGLPFTDQERVNQIAQNFEDYPGITMQENLQMVERQQQNRIEQPLAQQERDKYLREQQAISHEKFDKQLETKLQKAGPDVFKDIPGEMITNLKRGMDRDLRLNSNASIDDVVNKWTNLGLDLAKTNTQLDKLAKGSNSISMLLDKQAYRNKLKEYADIYKKAGNSEEYFNKLKTIFNMSPQGAASIAFERSKNVNNYIDKVRPSRPNDFANYGSNSKKYAIEIENAGLTSDDSLLAIARDLKQKDPYFDETAFFEQLSEDKDRLGLNFRQRREIAEGKQGILPTWGDILILPFFRGL